MLGHYFAPDQLRTLTVVFGRLFNDIYIKRDEVDKTELQKLKVPLNYGPADKVLARSQLQPELETPFALVLPRMSFQMIDFQYAPDRKMISTGKIRQGTKFTYNPVPYDFFFELYIIVKNTVDGTRIIEQILPFFTPDFNIPLKINPDLNETIDVPISIVSTNLEDVYQGDFRERRALVWTIRFQAKSYMYGPTRDAELIKHVQTNIYDGLDENLKPLQRTEIWPGLTTSGDPTTDPNQAIPYQEVEKDDNWDYIYQFDNDI